MVRWLSLCAYCNNIRGTFSAGIDRIFFIEEHTMYGTGESLDVFIDMVLYVYQYSHIAGVESVLS